MTGVCHWDEAGKSHPDYVEHRRQMTAEVAAACEGALAAGAKTIMVKDAHASGRNIIAGQLPPEAELIRGWSGHPYGMVQEITSEFRAALFIGYHSRAGSDGNPLAHTFSSGKIAYIRINDKFASEFSINRLIAADLGVPVVGISGDEAICREALVADPHITAVAVQKGIGNSVVAINPRLSLEKIRTACQTAISDYPYKMKLAVPEKLQLEIRYKQHTQAYRASFYPGVEPVDAHTVSYRTESVFDLVRAKTFLI